MRAQTLGSLAAMFFWVVSLLNPAFAHRILIGVVAHVMAHPNEQLTQFKIAREIGFDSVRTDAPWSRVETAKGVYKIPASWDQFVNRANRLGLEPLLILDYGNPLYDGGDKPRSKDAIAAFVRYATFVVNHFKGRVRYYEIWNEWDTRGGGFRGGNAQDYARLFNAVYPEVKKADPTAVFMVTSSSAGPGYARFYESLAQLGVLSKADAVAFHPYVFGVRGPEVGIQRVMELEAMMRARTDRDEIPIYITEDGWPTNSGAFGFTKGAVAAMAVRLLLLSSSLPYVKGVWWYDLRDDCGDDTNKECRFGLTREDYSFQPAARAIQRIIPFLDNSELKMQTAFNPKVGLVVLKRASGPGPSLIAWDVGPVVADSADAHLAYAVACDPSQRLLRGTRPALPRGSTISSTPSVFTYHSNGCARRPIMNSQ